MTGLPCALRCAELAPCAPSILGPSGAQRQQQLQLRMTNRTQPR